MNPCTRHLKCFDSCKHFIASGAEEHKVSLQQLRERLAEMKKAAEAKPVTSLGRKNQIEHAGRLLRGVNAALEAQPGDAVFRQGKDFSSRDKELFS